MGQFSDRVLEISRPLLRRSAPQQVCPPEIFVTFANLSASEAGIFAGANPATYNASGIFSICFTMG